MRTQAVVFLALLSGACGADFTDLRPESLIPPPVLPPPPPPSMDAGMLDGAAPPPPMEEMTLLQGSFEGLRSYSGSGQTSIVRRSDGGLEVRFAEDFVTSSVPGPVVVLTTRDTIGSRIDPGQGDLEIAPLTNTQGAQVYAIPEAGANAAYVWVFCKPFGVEIARAQLQVAP